MTTNNQKPSIRASLKRIALKGLGKIEDKLNGYYDEESKEVDGNGEGTLKENSPTDWRQASSEAHRTAGQHLRHEVAVPHVYQDPVDAANHKAQQQKEVTDQVNAAQKQAEEHTRQLEKRKAEVVAAGQAARSTYVALEGANKRLNDELKAIKQLEASIQAEEDALWGIVYSAPTLSTPPVEEVKAPPVAKPDVQVPVQPVVSPDVKKAPTVEIETEDVITDAQHCQETGNSGENAGLDPEVCHAQNFTLAFESFSKTFIDNEGE